MSGSRVAEEATLGALILRPHRVPDVGSWLRASDFADSWHADLYRSIVARAVSGTNPTPTELGLAFRDFIGPRRAYFPRFTDMLSRVPQRPEPLPYARIVLADSLRREVANYPIMLRAGAVASQARMTSDDLLAGIRYVRAWARQARARWEAAHVGQAVDSRSVVASAPRPRTADAQRRRIILGADRYLASRLAADPEISAQRQQALVGALIARPELIPAVAEWLTSDLLAREASEALRAAVLLQPAGIPVDEVTVAVEVSKAGGVDADVAADRLRHWMDEAGSADFRYLAKQVAADIVVSLAEGAQDSIRRAVSEARVGIPELLDHVQAEVIGLQRVAAGINADPLPRATAIGDDAQVVDIGAGRRPRPTTPVERQEPPVLEVG